MRVCVTSIVSTTLAYLIGGIDAALEVLLVIICLDIITGIIKAVKNGSYSSKCLREGIVHKVGYGIVIIICYQLDVLLLHGHSVTRTAAIIFYIAVEISSIVENLGQMGVPIPSVIAKRLQRLNEMSESDEEQIKEEK